MFSKPMCNEILRSVIFYGFTRVLLRYEILILENIYPIINQIIVFIYFLYLFVYVNKNITK